ncbi:hypothetical protein PV417_20080, partial [Streptomyces sp. ME19-03-3]|nr:hypothetical protein [Streptomyces sp. ME19-03-3]
HLNDHGPRVRPVIRPNSGILTPVGRSRELAQALVWDGELPPDDHEAGSAYNELYERYLESDDVVIPPAPRIVDYVEALLDRYPDDIDGKMVWASPPVINEASGPIVYLVMSYSEAEEVSEYAASLAREHGLVCYDPQGETLRP